MAGVLCQCGCPGARHTEWYEVDDVETKAEFQVPPVDTRPRKAPPTASSLKPSAPPFFTSFGNAAHAREGRRAADAAETAFDAKSSYFSNVRPAPEPSRAEQKRKRAASAGTYPAAPSAKRAATSPGKPTTYTFVLVEGTKAAHSPEGDKFPNENKLRILYQHDLVHALKIPIDATPSDLEQWVAASFSDVRPLVAATASMYGFVLLTKISRGRGARGVWVVNKRAGEFTTQDLQWSCEKQHRQARNFRNLVFIALSSWSKDLPIGSLGADNEEEDDAASTLSDGSEETGSRRPGDSVPRPRADSCKPECVITPLYRLIVNMCAPQNPHPSFPVRAEAPMDDVLATLPSHRKMLKKVTPDGALGTSKLVMDNARDEDGLVFHLRLVLGFNLEPGEDGYEDAAATFIRLGQFGLNPVIVFLYEVYEKALQSKVLTLDDLHLVCAQIDEVASRMYMHILAFRTSHPRDLYDPHPVGFLSRMLAANRSKFPFAEVSERFTTLDNTLGQSTVEDYADALEVDFGTSSDANSIRAGSLLLGRHGIDGLLSDWIYPVIDTLDVAHPTYQGMISLVLTFSQELALRLRDFTKAEGKSKARDASRDSIKGEGMSQPTPAPPEYESNDFPKAHGQSEPAAPFPVDDDVVEETKSAPREKPRSAAAKPRSAAAKPRSAAAKPRSTPAKAPKEAGGTTETSGYGTRSKSKPQSTGPAGAGKSGSGSTSNRPDSRHSSPSVIDVSSGSGSGYESESTSDIESSPVFTGPRKRFPYPESRPQRERPGRTPPPRPRPRPRLRCFTPPRVSDPAALSTIIGPRMLVQTVLEQFPHPDQNVRVSWSQVQDVDLGPQLLRRLMRVYHPDATNNFGRSPMWRTTCLQITQALNAKLGQTRAMPEK